MSMLAEPRKKSKYVLNPKKKPLWTSESSGIQFGMQLMEKMGWKAGKGLGAKEQGINEPLQVCYKSDSKGMGFKGNDDDWIQHQDEFNSLLNLLGGSDMSNETKHEKITVQSLEEKSKLSKARVHYQKFTRGKDLSRYSANDLACILGTGKKRNNNSKSVNEKFANDDNGTTETMFGVTTINGGSLTDYFKQKLKDAKSKIVVLPKVYDRYKTESHSDNEPNEFSVEVQAGEKKSKKGKNSKKIENPGESLVENLSNRNSVVEIPGNDNENIHFNNELHKTRKKRRQKDPTEEESTKTLSKTNGTEILDRIEEITDNNQDAIINVIKDKQQKRSNKRKHNENLKGGISKIQGKYEDQHSLTEEVNYVENIKQSRKKRKHDNLLEETVVDTKEDKVQEKTRSKKKKSVAATSSDKNCDNAEGETNSLIEADAANEKEKENQGEIMGTYGKQKEEKQSKRKSPDAHQKELKCTGIFSDKNYGEMETMKETEDQVSITQEFEKPKKGKKSKKNNFQGDQESLNVVMFPKENDKKCRSVTNCTKPESHKQDIKQKDETIGENCKQKKDKKSRKRNCEQADQLEVCVPKLEEVDQGLIQHKEKGSGVTKKMKKCKKNKTALENRSPGTQEDLNIGVVPEEEINGKHEVNDFIKSDEDETEETENYPTGKKKHKKVKKVTFSENLVECSSSECNRETMTCKINKCDLLDTSIEERDSENSKLGSKKNRKKDKRKKSDDEKVAEKKSVNGNIELQWHSHSKIDVSEELTCLGNKVNFKTNLKSKIDNAEDEENAYKSELLARGAHSVPKPTALKPNKLLRLLCDAQVDKFKGANLDSVCGYGSVRYRQ